MRKIVDDQGFRYQLYENDKGEFHLHIPLVEPAPGYDVVHLLSPNEVEEWKKKGKDAFDDRIVDMKKNYKNYKMISWR